MANSLSLKIGSSAKDGKMNWTATQEVTSFDLCRQKRSWGCSFFFFFLPRHSNVFLVVPCRTAYRRDA
jgi:hypothetical protein